MKSDRAKLLLKLIFMTVIFIELNGCQKNIMSKVEFTDNVVDLSSYKYFSWPDNKPMINNSTFIDLIPANRINESILEILETKGYKFTLNSTSADFIVSYALTSSNGNKNEPPLTLEIDNGKCFHPLSDSFSSVVIPVKVDRQSVMILSIFDVKRCVVVWQVRAKTLFNPYDSDIKQVKLIRSTVKALLSKFPIK